ncbi:hypothetical protein niasHS_006546 [Heterodera schachtii]|uniref:Uncharacterized protein n=1 Tax=Heterodera schachtii TaxID=97005 RepID=A0ABD2JHJ5_HETSC
MALQLVLLIDVDEKDQIMHTNVWLTLKWHDFQLKWNPVNYGGVKELRVSPEKVWMPDIVLFNNADGNYEVSFMSNVIIRDNGDMLWVPPAIYKSSCIIDVEYFPFDEQICHLIFGSWTYSENEMNMDFESSAGIDLSEYSRSHIWDVIGAPATLVNRRSRIEFQIRLRRKTLFYTIVLIIPTVLMAFLSMAVFFLPTDSGEKMTLTISVLLSIVVFLLVVSKIMPPTSSTIPLIAKYLLLTFVLNIITIAVTVIIINIYFRGPTTHQMPEWVRFVFLRIMPRLLCMKRPARPIVHVPGALGDGAARAVPLAPSSAVLPGIGNSDEVQLRWYNGKRFVELEDYSPSGIWDLMDVPGRMNADRSRIAFYIVIRRKTLFYTVILIIPTVLMAFLSMLAFYLPAECSEKITLAISILLALVVFLLLVSKILPPTSDTIPLMAKYLLMTFILNIVTIVSTVAVINVYFRSAITHTMPRCVRQLFLHFLPILLAMKRPRQREMFRGTSVEEYQATANGETNEHEGMDTNLAMGPSALAATMLPFLGHVGTVAQQKRKSWREKSRRMRQRIRTADGRDEAEEEETDDVRAADDDASPASSSLRSLSRNTSPLPQLMRRSRTGANLTTKAAAEGARNGNRQICAKLTGLMDDQKMGKKLRLTIESIAFIAEHIKAEMSDKKVRDDWRFISMVIDRMLLLLFFGITLGGTIGIMFSVPHVFEFVDQQEILRRLTFPSDVEERLIADLFRGYNHLIRPVPNVSSTPLEIRFSLALTLLINVDEKNQIMQTNVWPTMRWIDYQMQWNPLEYGNIRTIRVPPDKVWLPDIVLFNNADGNYEVSFYSNVVVEHNGEMLWVPPAIYKSSCIIDVEFFPVR